ncbi:MAG: DUF2304 family protein [Candidatus Woesearchaeota archaeon]
MEIVPIQIVIILFALFAFSRAVLRLKDKAITVGEFIFWSALWGFVIILAAHPAVGSIFSETFGVRRTVDFVIYVSLLLLFYLIFRIYVKTERLEQAITKLTRVLALEKAEQKRLK